MREGEGGGKREGWSESGHRSPRGERPSAQGLEPRETQTQKGPRSTRWGVPSCAGGGASELEPDGDPRSALPGSWESSAQLPGAVEPLNGPVTAEMASTGLVC